MLLILDGILQLGLSNQYSIVPDLDESANVKVLSAFPKVDQLDQPERRLNGKPSIALFTNSVY